jgi:hypothetical protein
MSRPVPTPKRVVPPACHTAARQLLLRLGDPEPAPNLYAEVFEAIIEELDEPDWAMLDAGTAELDRALADSSNRYKKDLARDVWRAMLARVPQ